jgi:hypothetical protein
MLRMTRILVLVALALPTVGLLLPGPALAQDPGGGVTVDPNSPSGTEYDIPVEKARRETDGKKKKSSVKAGGQSAPLFGEGVEPNSSTTPAPTTQSSQSQSSSQEAAEKKAKGKGQEAPAGPR